MRDLIHRPALLGLIVAAGLWAGSAGVGFAGNGNVLYLLQDSSPFGPGESFQSDQSHSSHSSIGSALQWVTQRGSGDSASVTINSACQAVSGSCGHADLMQAGYDSTSSTGNAHDLVTDAAAALVSAKRYSDDGTLGTSPLDESAANSLVNTSLGSIDSSGDNFASIVLSGSGRAAVAQYGSGNIADLTVSGGDGTLNQVGLNNSATLAVNAGSFVFNQIGQRNSANLAVTTPVGTSSTYTQVGLGNVWGTAGTPVAVDSTSGVNVAHYSY